MDTNNESDTTVPNTTYLPFAFTNTGAIVFYNTLPNINSNEEHVTINIADSEPSITTIPPDTNQDLTCYESFTTSCNTDGIPNYFFDSLPGPPVDSNSKLSIQKHKYPVPSVWDDISSLPDVPVYSSFSEETFQKDEEQLLEQFCGFEPLPVYKFVRQNISTKTKRKYVNFIKYYLKLKDDEAYKLIKKVAICPICQLDFGLDHRDPLWFYAHFTTHAINKDRPYKYRQLRHDRVVALKTFRCDTCKLTMKKKYDFLNHKCGEYYLCHICQQIFASLGDLLLHINKSCKYKDHIVL